MIKRRRADARGRVFQAWRTATWSRSQRIDSWERVASRLDRASEPAKTRDELFAQAAAIHFALTGRRMERPPQANGGG